MSLPFLILGIPCSAAEAPAGEKTTYADHVLPIFRNTCLNCHNPDKKKAGLDLSTYQAMMTGSDTGKVVEPGNPGNSLLFKLVAHTDEPKMPPKADKLPDTELAIIKRFIEGHALENSGSKVEMKQAGATPALVDTDETAAGPGPMPQDLILEPFVRTPKPGAVTALTSSPRSPLLAIAGQKQILLYHTGTLELLGILPFPEGFPDVVRFSRNGQVLLAGGGRGAHSGRVVLWEVATGQRLLSAGEEFDAVLAADISADHSYLALGGPSKLVKILSGTDGKLLHTMKKHTDWVTALSFSKDGKLLATGDRNGGLVVWESANGEEMHTLTGHKGAITSLSSAQALLASSSEDGTVKLWNLKDGKETKSWEAHKGGTLTVQWADKGRLVTSGRDKIVKLWDASGNQLKAFDPLPDIALQAALNSEKVFGSDWTGGVRVWNVADGKIAGELKVNPPPVAEQLSAVQQTLAQVEPRHQQAVATFALADKAVQSANQELELAKKSETEAQTRIKTTETDLATLTKALEETAKRVEQTRTELAQQAQTNQEELSKALATATADMEKAAAQVNATTEALNKAKIDAENATKALAAANERVKTTSAQIAPAQQAVTEAAQQLATAKSDVAKWMAAQVNISLHASRQRLAERKAETTQLLALAEKALEPATKAAADVAGAEKTLAEAPERIKKHEAALLDANKALETVKAASDGATKLVGEREALLQLSSGTAEKVAAEASKAAENKVLADAAEKAKATAELLKEELRQTQEAAAKRGEELKAAITVVASAEKVLVDGKQEIEAIPGRLPALREAAQVAAAKAAEAKAPIDQQVLAAQAKIVEAETEVARVTSEYQTLRQQVLPGTATPPAAVVSAK